MLLEPVVLIPVFGMIHPLETELFAKAGWTKGWTLPLQARVRTWTLPLNGVTVNLSQGRCEAFDGTNDESSQELPVAGPPPVLIKRNRDSIMQRSGKRTTSFELRTLSRLQLQLFLQRQGALCPKSRGTALS